MSEPNRVARLHADLEALESLKRESTIFDFEATGNPPDRYTFIFRGPGVKRDPGAGNQVELLDMHRCDVRLPYSYPERPPDIRWITSIFHPNISFSGFINLRDVGLPWQASVSLEEVCQRLWDVTRLGYVNLDPAVNFSARNWFKEQSSLALPLDARPLRDRVRTVNANVIRYERRGAERSLRPRSLDAGDVLFIGDENPAPRAAAGGGWNEGDDILYIE